MLNPLLKKWPPENSTNVRNIDVNKYLDPCKYTISKKVLGRGTYSRVYECRSKTSGKYYAAKQYNKRLVYGSESMLQNEFEILKKISSEHDGILTLVDYFETADNLYLVTNLAQGGELFDKIVDGKEGKLEENYASNITKNIIDVLKYLHGKNIAHCDIKAENILFKSCEENSTNILLADFGLAKFTPSGKKLYDVSGTLSYMAPEMLDRNKGYDFSVDIWALGVVVYFMLGGYMPFDHDNDAETKLAILKADYLFDPPNYWDHISFYAKDFISQCFIIDPLERPSAEKLLKHPFVNSCKLSNEDSIPLKKEYSTSNSNLANQLREALSVLQSQQISGSIHGAITPNRNSTSPYLKAARTLSRSNLTSQNLSSIGSKLSLLDEPTLNGACCVSPEAVSNFTSPMQSTATTRQPSTNDLLKIIPTLHKFVDLKPVSNQPKFFI